MSVARRLVPHVPPTGAQRYAWFAQSCSGRPARNEPVVLRLTGPVDVPALRAALDAVVDRHPVLGSSMVVRDGVLTLCRPDGAFRPELSVVDVPAGSDVRALCDRADGVGDPRSGPLLGLRLLRVSPSDHVLVLDTHRLVCDAPSVAVLVSELAALHAAAAAGTSADLADPPVRFADVARWQQAWLRGPGGQEDLAYWRRRLAGLVPLDLPADRPRPADPTWRAAEVCRRVAGTPDTELVPALVTALAAVLTRYTGQDDVVLGLRQPRASDLAGAVGPFEDPVVLRLDASGDPALGDLLGRSTTEVDAAVRHAGVPFADVADRLGPAGRHPAFAVELAVRDAGPTSLPGLPGRPLTRQECPVVQPLELGLDLSVTAERTAGALRLRFRYAAELFDRWRIERLADHVVGVLGAVRRDPGRRLWRVDLLSEPERARLLTGWQGPDRPYPKTPVHAQVSAQAARTPDATALVDDHAALSYRELELRSNRLANHLRSRGAGPEVPVGVFLPRGVDLVVAMLAVLKTGGCHVPLDLGHPAGRIAMMLADARVGLVVTRRDLRDRLPDTRGVTVVSLDAEDEAIRAAGDSTPDTGWHPDRLCHVVFTSGSTGRPKGVAACHGNVVSYLSGLLDTVGADRFARVLFSTAASFDACLVELWPPLLVGGTLVVVDNLLVVSDRAAQHDGVTLVNTVPSVLAEYLRLGPLPRGLRTLTIGAEPLPAPLVERVLADSSVEELYNMYGPTETTAYATMRRITRSDTTVTIGRPLPNVRAYLLDRTGCPAPVGVPGELHLGGPGVARGYLGRGGQTAERFRPDHLSGVPGARLYRTGDLARWTPSGEIEFLGRVDTQVKLRGFRIELGEIEATLARHPAVAGAVAAVREDPAGEPQLVGYVVPVGPTPQPEALGAWCRATLPHYMEPAAFVAIPAVPRGPTGKVDRGALPDPDWPNRRAGDRAPTPAEQELRALVTPGAGEAAVGGWAWALRASHRVGERFGVRLGVWDVHRLGSVDAVCGLVAGALRNPNGTAGGTGGVPGGDEAAAPRPRWEGCDGG